MGRDPSKAIISYDFNTARSDNPKYPVLEQNKDGIYIPMLDDNNMPLVFQPNIAESGFMQDMREESGQVVEKAKRKREFKEGRREFKTRRKILDIMEIHWRDIPKEDRAEWLKTEEGNARLNQTVNSLIEMGEIPAEGELILESMRPVFDVANP